MSLAPHLLVAGGLEGAGEGDVVPMADAARHHLHRVLRLAEGARLSLTDGSGRSGDAVLVEVGARLVGPVVVATPLTPRLVLAQALSKGRRAEDAVRAACELGVDRLVPVVAARTQGRPDERAEAAIVARWESVAVAALEQSRGVWRAEVTRPVGVDVLVAGTPDALRLVAVPGAPALPSVVGGARPAEVVVAVGPEGGWAPDELAAFSAAGWRAVGLGPSVLRTEHAGPVAVAVVAALLGRWGSERPAGGAGAPGATLSGPSVEEPRPPVSGPL